jgi:hypothetical protein
VNEGDITADRRFQDISGRNLSRQFVALMDVSVGKRESGPSGRGADLAFRRQAKNKPEHLPATVELPRFLLVTFLKDPGFHTALN